MGYSISWLAVRGEEPSAMRQKLSLAATDEFEEIPESPICGAEMPEGWYLVFANRSDFAETQRLPDLSEGCEVVTCSVEEHVMVSSASGWKDGNRDWSILHDSQRGSEHLEVEGRPPWVLEAVRERLTAEQRRKGDADYVFDVPVELAREITGFRHDRDFKGFPPLAFQRLEQTKRVWWRFWGSSIPS